MNEHEIARIAAAIHELRPDWPASSLRTIITTHLADKPRRDVCVALAWVACEAGTSTPKRVLEQGPWWRAAGVDSAPARQTYDAADMCSVCSQPEPRCRQVWSEDHEFLSVNEARRTRKART